MVLDDGCLLLNKKNIYYHFKQTKKRFLIFIFFTIFQTAEYQVLIKTSTKYKPNSAQKKECNEHFAYIVSFVSVRLKEEEKRLSEKKWSCWRERIFGSYWKSRIDKFYCNFVGNKKKAKLKLYWHLGALSSAIKLKDGIYWGGKNTAKNPMFYCHFCSDNKQSLRVFIRWIHHFQFSIASPPPPPPTHPHTNTPMLLPITLLKNVMWSLDRVLLTKKYIKYSRSWYYKYTNPDYRKS